MKKRLLMVLFCLTLAFSMTACGDNDSSKDDDKKTESESDKDADDDDEDDTDEDDKDDKKKDKEDKESDDDKSDKKDSKDSSKKSDGDDSNWINSMEYYDNLSPDELIEELDLGMGEALDTDELTEDLFNEYLYFLNALVASMKNDEDEWIQIMIDEGEAEDEEEAREYLEMIVESFDEEMSYLTYDSFAKYESKSMVSSDMQLCDTIRTAIYTSLFDPEVIENAKEIPSEGDYSLEEFLSDDYICDEFEDIIGRSVDEVEDMIKSDYNGKKASGIRVKFDGANQITVYIENSCAEGVSGEDCDNCTPIYAGSEF